MLVLRIMSSAAALALVTACSAEPGTGPAGQTSAEAPFDPHSEEGGFVRLSGDGLRTTGSNGFAIPFGTSRQLTETAVDMALGAPEARQENNECGAGPMKFSNYGSGLTLNYQNGNLVGWYLDADEGEGEAEAAEEGPPKVTTAENIAIGTALMDSRRVYSLQQIEDSTLGEEYAADEGMGIFAIDTDLGKEISGMYAGLNCFFR